MDTALPPKSLLPFSTPELIGISLGPYRILELIGRGGMATVYKAYQPGTERLVALKVLLNHLVQDSLAIQRFQQEARIIAGLEHRNIVPVYDSGQQDGTLYLVMRYMRAGTVQDIIARGPLPLRDALSIISDVAAALDYAHALGIIHRDIKPNNILVDNEGHAYLTDFGLAKVLGATDEMTNTSMMMGTPAYMAPEQALGRPVTPQTDIYALGAMLYEMLTGKPPFSAESPMAIVLAAPAPTGEPGPLADRRIGDSARDGQRTGRPLSDRRGNGDCPGTGGGDRGRERPSHPSRTDRRRDRSDQGCGKCYPRDPPCAAKTGSGSQSQKPAACNALDRRRLPGGRIGKHAPVHTQHEPGVTHCCRADCDCRDAAAQRTKQRPNRHRCGRPWVGSDCAVFANPPGRYPCGRISPGRRYPGGA